MLIGPSRRRPNLEQVRRIKRTLRQALNLSDGEIITLAELACSEEDCTPMETVFGLLRPDAPQLQYTLHKPTDAVDVEDLVLVCKAWGFDVQIPMLQPQEKQ